MRLAATCLLATLVLAGCSSSPHSTPPATSSNPGAPTSSPGGAPTGNATDEPLKCVTQVGATGNANVNDGVGGCVLSPGISSPGTVLSMKLATGCTSWYDATPGDHMTDGAAKVGGNYTKGTSFGVYCDASMPPNSESDMVIHHG
ncbi:MAG: hypothetical protein ACYDBQ_11860 [Thermoplasmatota archaeon]